MFSVFKKGFWFFGLVVFLLILFLPGFTKLQELRDRNQELQAKIKKLNVENALLQQELNRLLNDPVYQEGVAREKLGVARKGEIPVKVLPKKE